MNSDFDGQHSNLRLKNGRKLSGYCSEDNVAGVQFVRVVNYRMPGDPRGDAIELVVLVSPSEVATLSNYDQPPPGRLWRDLTPQADELLNIVTTKPELLLDPRLRDLPVGNARQDRLLRTMIDCYTATRSLSSMTGQEWYNHREDIEVRGITPDPDRFEELVSHLENLGAKTHASILAIHEAQNADQLAEAWHQFQNLPLPQSPDAERAVLGSILDHGGAARMPKLERAPFHLTLTSGRRLSGFVTEDVVAGAPFVRVNSFPEDDPPMFGPVKETVEYIAPGLVAQMSRFDPDADGVYPESCSLDIAADAEMLLAMLFTNPALMEDERLATLPTGDIELHAMLHAAIDEYKRTGTVRIRDWPNVSARTRVVRVMNLGIPDTERFNALVWRLKTGGLRAV